MSARFKIDITDPKLVNEFWKRVDVGTQSECWVWKAGKNKKGYGIFWLAYSQVTGAHRFSLALSLGRQLEKQALHRCDNPPCVNPHHLYEGDTQQNTADRVAKGRSSRKSINIGSDNPLSKLDDQSVKKIKERVRLGEMQKDLAGEFDVSISTVSRICSGERWAHVDL